MKKTFITFLSASVLFSCNNSEKADSQKAEEQIVTTEERRSAPETESPKLAFDINSISVSTVDIGDFPFFTAPEGAQYINRPKVKEFDFIVFVTPDSIYEVEGKTFRTHVHPDRKSETEVSGRYLIKSFEEAITNAGGVKVYEGNLDKEQKDRYKTLCTYAGSNGSIDIWNNAIATYVIRRNDGNVYIAIDKGNSNTTSIQIVQEKPFVQTIKKVTSDEIKNDLLENGKAVLHINFDTDKATLKPNGIEVVNEITKVLKAEPELKIAINGYTDNSGTKDHNQKLSEDRALAVKSELVKSGIAADRLKSKGYGQDNPILDNSTDDGKAKNRRVELVKF